MKILILNLIQNFKGPIVIDADAVSAFQHNKKLIYDVLIKKKNVVLTPHKGEFSRLFQNKSKSMLRPKSNQVFNYQATLVLLRRLWELVETGERSPPTSRAAGTVLQ